MKFRPVFFVFYFQTVYLNYKLLINVHSECASAMLLFNDSLPGKCIAYFPDLPAEYERSKYRVYRKVCNRELKEFVLTFDKYVKEQA